MFSVSCHLLSVLIKARTYTDIQLLMQFVHIKDRDIAFSCLFIECVCVCVCISISLCSLVQLLPARTVACEHNKVAESNSKNEKA